MIVGFKLLKTEKTAAFEMLARHAVGVVGGVVVVLPCFIYIDRLLNARDQMKIGGDVANG